MDPAISHALNCANHYRRVGLCPLPSKMHIKGPMLDTYSEHYGPTPVPENVYRDWRTTNVQVLTGVRTPTPTKVIVVDLDGPKACEAWARIASANGMTVGATWIARTGGGGFHHWFLVPPETESCPSGLIWGLYDTWGRDGKGEWAKHKEVRILADNALVVSPPSIHVDTGKPYTFLDGLGPRHFRLPSLAPQWLLDMPRLSRPRFGPDPAPRPAPRQYVRTSDHWYTREEVLDAMGSQKLAVAKEWGLATRSDAPNSKGWVTCFVPGREDPRTSRPSGSFSFSDGTLQDRKDMTTVSLFDLGVQLGHFATWQSCRDSLGDRFIGKRCVETSYKYVF